MAVDDGGATGSGAMVERREWKEKRVREEEARRRRAQAMGGERRRWGRRERNGSRCGQGEGIVVGKWGEKKGRERFGPRKNLSQRYC